MSAEWRMSVADEDFADKPQFAVPRATTEIEALGAI
jgi:hypothetical protein